MNYKYKKPCTEKYRACKGIYKLIKSFEILPVLNRNFSSNIATVVALGHACDLATDCTDEVYNVVDVFLIPTCPIFKILPRNFHDGAITEIFIYKTAVTGFNHPCAVDLPHPDERVSTVETSRLATVVLCLSGNTFNHEHHNKPLSVGVHRPIQILFPYRDGMGLLYGETPQNVRLKLDACVLTVPGARIPAPHVRTLCNLCPNDTSIKSNEGIVNVGIRHGVSLHDEQLILIAPTLF